jgi:hypothetical protein
VSFLWKSQDHGAQWDLVHALPNALPAQRPSGTHGGGDSEIVIGPKVKGKPGYTVSFYDLESLADIGVATSFDSGKTFDAQTTNALAGDTVGTDRQWGQLWRDPKGQDHLFLLYNALQSNNGKGTILRESLDYGKTWKNLGDGGTLNGVFDAGALGQLRIDQAGNLFFTSENSPAVNLVRGMRQKDGSYRFSSTTVSCSSRRPSTARATSTWPGLATRPVATPRSTPTSRPRPITARRSASRCGSTPRTSTTPTSRGSSPATPAASPSRSTAPRPSSTARPTPARGTST